MIFYNLSNFSVACSLVEIFVGIVDSPDYTVHERTKYLYFHEHDDHERPLKINFSLLEWNQNEKNKHRK